MLRPRFWRSGLSAQIRAQRGFHFHEFSTRTLTAIAAALALVVVVNATAKANDDRDDNKFSVYLDRDVHPTALNDKCTSPQLWQGSGNAATTFQRMRNVEDGVELAIKSVLRSVGGDQRSTYVDASGRVHIEVPSGSQTMPSAQTNRAKWNFAFSVDVGLKPGNPMLDGYDAELWIDLGPTERTKFLKLELKKFAPPAVAPTTCGDGNANGFGWFNGATAVIPDDEGPVTGPTALQVTQNSQKSWFLPWSDRRRSAYTRPSALHFWSRPVRCGFVHQKAWTLAWP